MNRKDFISTVTLSFTGIYTNEKPVKCTIRTNRVCEKCKYGLGRNIVFEKGVRDVVVDTIKKNITITYDSSKTNPEKLRKYIVSIGYDADEQKANVYKREQVHDCCLIDTTICR